MVRKMTLVKRFLPQKKKEKYKHQIMWKLPKPVWHVSLNKQEEIVDIKARILSPPKTIWKCAGVDLLRAKYYLQKYK